MVSAQLDLITNFVIQPCHGKKGDNCNDVSRMQRMAQKDLSEAIVVVRPDSIVRPEFGSNALRPVLNMCSLRIIEQNQLLDGRSPGGRSQVCDRGITARNWVVRHRLHFVIFRLICEI